MKSKYFKLGELVPITLFNTVHHELLWNMLDDGTLQALDHIKEKFNQGTITVNNWLWGGDRNWSGIRTKDSKYYSVGSMHSVGKAFDMIFSNYSTEEVRQYILDHPKEFPTITRIEGNVNWLHIDTKSTGLDHIQIFYA